jgi:hypothetical protein
LVEILSTNLHKNSNTKQSPEERTREKERNGEEPRPTGRETDKLCRYISLPIEDGSCTGTGCLCKKNHTNLKQEVVSGDKTGTPTVHVRVESPRRTLPSFGVDQLV